MCSRRGSNERMAPQESKKTDNFKPVVLSEFQAAVDNQARVSAQKVFAARLEGRDLAAEKRDARKRMVVDRVEDLLES